MCVVVLYYSRADENGWLTFSVDAGDDVDTLVGGQSLRTSDGSKNDESDGACSSNRVAHDAGKRVKAAGRDGGG